MSPRLQRAVRLQTILSMAQAMLRRQQHFLANGLMAMKPMALREIADQVGVHESAVSRATGEPCRMSRSRANWERRDGRWPAARSPSTANFCGSSPPILDAAKCFHILKHRGRLPFKNPVLRPIELPVSEAFLWERANQSEVLPCRQLMESRCRCDFSVCAFRRSYPVFVGAVRHTFPEASSTMPASFPVNGWSDGAGSSVRALQARLRRADKLSSCTAGAAGIRQRTRE